MNRFVYTPYGQRTVLDGTWTVGSTDFMLGHQGLTLDGESGMYYNRARYFHPTLGQFAQRDPLGYVDGGSLYQYERGDSTALVDPQGFAASLAMSPAASLAMSPMGGPGAMGDPDLGLGDRLLSDSLRHKGLKVVNGRPVARSLYYKGKFWGSFQLKGPMAGTTAGAALESGGLLIIWWEIHAMFEAQDEAWDAISDAEQAAKEANAANQALWEALMEKWLAEEEASKKLCEPLQGDFYPAPSGLA